MAIPKLFGAPAPQSGGGIRGSIDAAQGAAQMQTQAVQAAAQMLLGTLQSAMELRFRRDEQIRGLDAAAKLEAARLDHQTRMQDDAQKFARQQNRMQERGLNRRALFEEKGQNRRFDASMGVQREHLGLQRESLGLERERNTLLNAETAERLRAAHQAELDKRRLEEQKKLAMQGLTAGMLDERGVPDFAGIRSILQAAQPPQEMVGPVTPGQDAAMQPDALMNVLQQMQKAAAPQQELGLAYEGLEAKGGRGGLSGTGAAPMGQFPISDDVLKELEGMATGADRTVLRTLSQSAAAGNGPRFEVQDGALRFHGAGAAEEILNRLVSTPGGAERVVGSALAPLMPASEQLKYGAGVLGTGRAAPRPQKAAAAAPQRPQQGPPAAPAEPQAPAQAPQADEGGGQELVSRVQGENRALAEHATQSYLSRFRGDAAPRVPPDVVKPTGITSDRELRQRERKRQRR